jgi:hypothetical protein
MNCRRLLDEPWRQLRLFEQQLVVGHAHRAHECSLEAVLFFDNSSRRGCLAGPPTFEANTVPCRSITRICGPAVTHD